MVLLNGQKLLIFWVVKTASETQLHKGTLQDGAITMEAGGNLEGLFSM
jgi:hypothetical protein